VWEILHDAGIDPASERASTKWAAFLRSQAEVILAADFEAVTLTGKRMYVAVIEHATRQVHVLGATAHPSAAWAAKPSATLRLSGTRPANAGVDQKGPPDNPGARVIKAVGCGHGGCLARARRREVQPLTRGRTRGVA